MSNFSLSVSTLGEHLGFFLCNPKSKVYNFTGAVVVQNHHTQATRGGWQHHHGAHFAASLSQIRATGHEEGRLILLSGDFQ